MLLNLLFFINTIFIFINEIQNGRYDYFCFCLFLGILGISRILKHDDEICPKADGIWVSKTDLTFDYSKIWCCQCVWLSLESNKKSTPCLVQGNFNFMLMYLAHYYCWLHLFFFYLLFLLVVQHPGLIIITKNEDNTDIANCTKVVHFPKVIGWTKAKQHWSLDWKGVIFFGIYLGIPTSFCGYFWQPLTTICTCSEKRRLKKMEGWLDTESFQRERINTTQRLLKRKSSIPTSLMWLQECCWQEKNSRVFFPVALMWTNSTQNKFPQLLVWRRHHQQNNYWKHPQDSQWNQEKVKTNKSCKLCCDQWL